jgi:ParB family transcriptional regulator, chromosome partitioning protein
MRLQNLPQRVHGWLTSGALTMGHARALINATDPEGLAKQVIAKALSVRQAEALVRRASRGDAAPRAPKKGPVHDADIQALERQLSDLLGLKTDIRHAGKDGSVTLHYSSLEQLDMICQRLSGERI